MQMKTRLILPLLDSCGFSVGDQPLRSMSEAEFGLFSTVTKLLLMRGKITPAGKITDVGKYFPIEYDG